MAWSTPVRRLRWRTHADRKPEWGHLEWIVPGLHAHQEAAERLVRAHEAKLKLVDIQLEDARTSNDIRFLLGPEHLK